MMKDRTVELKVPEPGVAADAAGIRAAVEGLFQQALMK